MRIFILFLAAALTLGVGFATKNVLLAILAGAAVMVGLPYGIAALR